MDIILSPEELKNDQIGKRVSIAYGIILLIILLLPFLRFEVPPPGQAGVLVSFGEPNQGQNDDRAAPAPVQEEAAEDEPVEEVVKEQPKRKVTQPPKAKPVSAPARNVNSDANSDAIAIKNQKERDRKEKLRQEQAERDAEEAKADEIERKKEAIAQKKRDAAERKRQAAAAAQRKKEADAQALKDAISGGLSGSGQGSGNGGADGDQGQPDGDPNGTALDGISTGAGDIGGGLGNRGLLYSPKITNNSQKTGRVVVKVCVDASGKVISSSYTQAGSSTNDPGLIATAESSARKYKFSKGTLDRQCGTITIIFKLK